MNVPFYLFVYGCLQASTYTFIFLITAFLTYFYLFIQIEASLQSAGFTKLAYENASLFDETNFPEDIKRQFEFIKDIGSAALEDESKIEEVSQHDLIFMSAKKLCSNVHNLSYLLLANFAAMIYECKLNIGRQCDGKVPTRWRLSLLLL